MKGFFKKYLQELSQVAQHGDAREESFYGALASKLEEFAGITGRKHVQVTMLPKSTDAGNPDFRVWNGDRITGYVEAKNPTEERLDYIEESEQLQRYRSTFPNLILTNFYEFRLYRNGERVDTVLLARPFVQTRLQTTPPPEKPEQLAALLEHFYSFSLPQSFTAETLAVELAKRTRFLREVVTQQLNEEQGRPGALTGFYDAFKQYLIGDLTQEVFADLYAQTITYGLFASKTRAGEGFNRRTAFDSIPHTIGVLRDLFRYISLEDLPIQLEWIIDEISNVLAAVDVSGILSNYFKEGKGSDPIVHFYETFLSQYDPEERERRGVYYTPEPVVSYIVRSLHGLLKAEFGKTDGLASEGVTLLDPAAGTMTFVARAAQEAVSEFESKYGTGAREDFIRRHILQNFYAFELMMAPYAIGHLKMGFFLDELGHRLDNDERVRFYLTNTLDMEELEQSRLPGLSSLAEESRFAGEVKKQAPILVILGNPPYSGISSNTGNWITNLIDNYKYVDGAHFGEKKHWLHDDYVKFLRFAQWKIDEAGHGIVGMITNHGYIDNPTFRGMRQSLMQTFDDIFVLDLHGNSLKKEVSPDGSKDVNVFDIRQGVAIAFFIKHRNSEEKAAVHHAELWGSREYKYEWLENNDFDTTGWEELQPESPNYFFTSWDEMGNEKYREFMSIPQIFPVNVTGIVTARDGFVIDIDSETLLRRISQFRDLNLNDEFIRDAYKLKDTRGWKLPEKRLSLSEVANWRSYVKPCFYRPFDIRSIFYHPDMVDWPRLELMRHMLAGENMALITPRQHKNEFGAMVARTIGGHKSVAAYDINYYFPLYLYREADVTQLTLDHMRRGTPERSANIREKVVEELSAVYKKQPTPESIFFYVYAILYSPLYRDKYTEFLRMDFPRVPFPVDFELFKSIASLGERLAGMHLLESSELDPPETRFEGQGDGRVAKSRNEGFLYDNENQRVYINNIQYFAPVPPEVWSYRVGGYRVCDKWLKDRKQRRLDIHDIRTYCRIVTALNKTIGIQGHIDEFYPAVEADAISWD